MALEGGYNIGDVDTRDSISIIDSTANIQRDKILDSIHTPRMDTDLVDWIFTISITGCKFDRRLQDDSRCITSDVFSSRPTSSVSTNIATYDRHSPQRPTRLFKQPRVVSDREWQRCPGAAGDNIWVDQHYHRRPIFRERTHPTPRRWRATSRARIVSTQMCYNLYIVLIVIHGFEGHSATQIYFNP